MFIPFFGANRHIHVDPILRPLQKCVFILNPLLEPGEELDRWIIPCVVPFSIAGAFANSGLRNRGRKMEPVQGVIAVDLFSPEVDGTGHPEAVRFRALLEDVAGEYGCELVYFEVESGTVSFSFNDDLLMADVLKLLKHDEPCES